MMGGIFSWSNFDSKRSKQYLKEEWKRSGCSDWNGFAERNRVSEKDVLERIHRDGESYKFNCLLDHLVEGPDATPVSEDIYANFRGTIRESRVEGTPKLPERSCKSGEHTMWSDNESENEQDPHRTRAQADKDDSDEQKKTVQGETPRSSPPPLVVHTTGGINRWCSLNCRLVLSIGIVVALSVCAMHFEDLENKFAEVVMNNPLLSAQWDTLGGKSIRILVTGKTGTGKSTLINGLMGQKVAAEGDTLDPETSEVQQIKRMVQGVSMSIFDSPGLQDGTQREHEYLHDMQRKCRSIDLVLYAIRMTDQRVHAEDTKAMKKLTKAFGVELWNRAIFVMTFANEVQHPTDPEDEIKTEAHFKKRLEVWRENLPEIVAERTNIPIEIARHIPIIPAGYYNIRDLPGQSFWFTEFWLAALKRMREAGANGADYMLEFSKDRIKKSDQTTEKDFEKPIYEQPIVYEE